MLGLRPDDMAAMRARGPWLAVAWLLAAASFTAAYTAGRAWWPALLASPLGGSDLLLTLAVLQTANVGQELIWNLVMYAIMWARMPFFERYRCEGPAEWPWFSADASKRAHAWGLSASSLWRALVVNNLFVGTPLIMTTRWLLREAGLTSPLRADLASFPSAATVLWQLAACLVIEDACFYWVHRTMHENKWLYANVHKIHHQYMRSMAVSASEHAHWFEFIAGNLLPVIAPVLLLRMHLFAAGVFVAVRIFISAEEHCGYAFPWSPVRLLPWQACVAGHDYHHTHNQGVYASQFTFWDRWCGTDAAFVKWQRARLQGGDASRVHASLEGRGQLSSGGSKKES